MLYCKPIGYKVVALNKNQEIKRLLSASDSLARTVTRVIGSMPFLITNVLIFIFWLLINSGQFGTGRIFDPFPFSLLTMFVSLEAIILSIFVLITQNRQSKLAQLRAELDYQTDLQSEADVEVLVAMLERLARKQGIDVDDLIQALKVRRAEVLEDYPISKM